MAPSYRFGKGPIVVALEAELSAKATFDKLYKDLDEALIKIKGAQQTTQSAFKQQLPQADRDHLDRDVFGKGQTDPAAQAEGQQRRLVYYEGLKQGMDLARKLGSVEVPAPIEVFWGCGQRVNECWISWNKTGRPGVTLFFLSTDPATAETDQPGITPANPPDPKKDPTGLYVVRPSGQTTATYEADPNVIGV
jgi:hypothetical protein